MNQDDQFPLFYPESPGYQDTDTSEAAAESMQMEVNGLRALCLEAIVKSPLTPDEVARCIGRDRLAIRPRITELKEMGLIEDSGERRSNVSGRKAIVYRRRLIDAP